jgi:cytochrome c6
VNKCLQLLTLLIGLSVNSLVSAQSVQPEATVHQLYKKKCGLCHGEDGKKCFSKASDLSKSTLLDSASVHIITEGKNKMPGFSKKLSTQEIHQINAYIKTLRTPK